MDATANGTFEGGTDVNVAEEIVDKTMDRIKDASDAAADTDELLIRQIKKQMRQIQLRMMQRKSSRKHKTHLIKHKPELILQQTLRRRRMLTIRQLVL